jgi:hypothetical protein
MRPGYHPAARYIRRTVRSVLGEVKIRKRGADSLDALYTVPKKCCRLSIGSRGPSTCEWRAFIATLTGNRG